LNAWDDTLIQKEFELKTPHGRDEKCLQNLCRKPEEKRPLLTLSCRVKDVTRMNLIETGWKGVK
jgi:hypothetical protein